MAHESTIRKMTRLAHEYKAVNLSQGFPNEPPPWSIRIALAQAVLQGQPTTETATKESLLHLLNDQKEEDSDNDDQLNQYSPPMGRFDLRQAVAKYYERFYQYGLSPDTQVTITLGATEAVACALRATTQPGDRVVMFEPFHELYPNQCRIFYLEPVFCTLRAETKTHEGITQKAWRYDPQALEEALKDNARVLLLNTPHNPTGKVFTYDELHQIVQWCIQYNVTIITDEIYEHMCFNTHEEGEDAQQHENKHYLLPKTFPNADVLVCNSMGKSASATGWRLGWCIHSPERADAYRGIHDQLTVMSPHPMQYAALTYFTVATGDYFTELALRYQRRVTKLSRHLHAVGLHPVVPPAAAYYLLVEYQAVPVLADKTPLEAALYLLQHVGVACVPGDNFYGTKELPEAQKYLRFAACRSDEDLDEAGRRLKVLLKRRTETTNESAG